MRSNKIQHPLLLVILLFLAANLSSCKGPQSLARKGKKQITKEFQNSEVFNQAFTGFALYEPVEKKWLYQKDSDKYFTPASNIKILTLYASLKILGDSIPLLKYYIQGDSLIFQGTAHPGLAHPYLPKDSTVYHFLRSRKEQLFFSSANFEEKAYGPGWAWDDIPYGFQCQRSPLPIHANRILFDWQVGTSRPLVSPAYFERFLQAAELEQNGVIKIPPFSNNIYYNNQQLKKNYIRSKPFHYTDSLVCELLSAFLQKEVNIWEHRVDNLATTTIYDTSPDTLYRRMMHRSDNFISEQLLLACSQKDLDTISSKKIIKQLRAEDFKSLQDPPLWFDGSGLSRYNLMTPRSIVSILNMMYQTYGEQRLFELFAAGGQSGTIKKWYAGEGQPYIYAKTGTMSNRHCLSGFLITKQGKTLIFSFMHNNYPGGSKAYKAEMQDFLALIRTYY